MEFITENLSTIFIVLAGAYPSLVFLLPPQIAHKLDLGIKIFKTVSEVLEKAKDTKSGFSLETKDDDIKKPFIQKSRS